MESSIVERALISVSDKSGLVDFAAQLVRAGIEIVSTGGTARFLTEHQIPVTDVADVTGFPEVMDGRVKTLHPGIFAGILARRDHPGDRQTLRDMQLPLIDLVVVNLYPFEQTVARSGVSHGEAIEQIDIGGPSLLRAAAKNSQFVTVVTSPQHYAEVARQIGESGTTTLGLRRQLMVETFRHTSHYDRIIASHFELAGAGLSSGETVQRERSREPFPETWMLSLLQKQPLRYGENSHQAAALYTCQSGSAEQSVSLVQAQQRHGKELSYNNYLDLHAALEIVADFDPPACSVIKHNNPCGVAVAEDLPTACQRAFASDPVSAFGSIVGLNRVVDLATAEFFANNDLFVESILAVGFDDDALEVLTTRPKWKKSVRLLSLPNMAGLEPQTSVRQISGGFLVQQPDRADDESSWTTVTEVDCARELRKDLEVAWQVVRHVKSNAIVLVKDEATIGIGAGQMSRIDSVNISIDKAGERATGSVLASDAFFPFADSIHQAHAAGIRAVIQPGGSKRDAEVIAACNESGIAMIFTGRRHFKH